MPSRRSVLSTCGLALAGLGGCVEGPTGGAESDTVSPTPPPTATDSPVDVSTPRVRDAVVGHDSPDSMTARDPEGWFVLASVRANESDDQPPRAGAFSLALDDRPVSAVDPRTLTRYRVDGFGTPYRRDDPDGWVAFEVPAEAGVSTAEVRVGPHRWPLPDSVVSRLNEPTPTWSLDVSFPDRLVTGERFEVTVTARNTSTVPGTFCGALNVAELRYAYYPYPFAESAGPDETATVTHSDSVPEGATHPSFYLRTQAGSESRSYEVRDSEQ
jgi:hypothetical protein